MKQIILPYLILSLFFVACDSKVESEQLDKVEEVMMVNLDSAATMLSEMPKPTSSEANIARYYLIDNWIKYARYEKTFDIESLEHAYHYFNDGDSNLRKAQVNYLKGAIYDQLKIGDEELKALCYFTAAKAIEKTDNHQLAAQIYQRIAAEMNSRHAFQEALDWGQKYCLEAQKSGDAREEVIALLNLAMAHCWHSDSICEANHDFENGYRESIALSHEALSIATAHNNVDGMMRANDKLSAFYSRAQKADSALHYALIADSLIYVVEAKEPSHQKRGHSTLADAYRKVGKKLRAEYEETHDRALLSQIQDIAAKAMMVVEKDFSSANPVTRQNAAQLGYLISKDLLKDTELSLFYMGRFNHIQDSLQRAQQNLKVMTAPIRIEKEEVEATLDKTRHQLWWVVAISFALLLVVSSIMIFLSRRNRRVLNKLKDELNEALAAAEEIAKKQKEEENKLKLDPNAALVHIPVKLPKADPEKPIVIESATNESLTVRPVDLLYITVESNNLYIAYINDGKLKTKSIRSTMKVVDQQLLPFTNIVRCHRAFMVNLSHVKYAVTTSAGLSLLLDVNELIVPVSRSFVDSIKVGLKEYSQC